MSRPLVFLTATLVGCVADKEPGAVPPGGHAQGFEVGDEPLDFTLPGTDGELVSLSDYAGRRILVVGTSGW